MSVDYLKPTGRVARVLAFIGCFVATAVCCLFVAVAIKGLRMPGASAADLKTGWFIVIFFGIIGAATTAIGYRLARGTVAQNRLTTMPIWFIQAFGVFFLVGVVWVGFAEGKWLIVLEGSSLALAMIFIGRQIAKRRQKRSDKASEQMLDA